MKKTRLLNILDSLNIFYFWTLPSLTTVAVLGYYTVVMEKELNSSKTFVTLTTLLLLQEPLRSIPSVITKVIQMVVSIKRIQELIDFEGFDNQNGNSHPIIPNIAHYIFLNKPTIEFYHMVNIFSLFFNHRPEKIYFHCDNCSFTGKFFDALKSNKELWSLIDIHHIPPKKTIFGQEYGYGNFHR